jgi:hypothetical protein
VKSARRRSHTETAFVSAFEKYDIETKSLFVADASMDHASAFMGNSQRLTEG